MGNKVDFSIFVKSQNAIREYMELKKENEFMHKARVLVSSRGECKYNSIVDVIPRIETNESTIDIIGDTRFEDDYYIRYTNVYQVFSYINGTLIIKAEDRWGNSVEIDVTSV